MFDTPMTRRQALRRIYRAIVATGAAQFLSFEQLLAADRSPEQDRLNLIWLHGTSCSGCSTSFLDVEDVPILDILTKFANVVFHPDLSAATGHQVPELIERLEGSNQRYLFTFEGGIPVDMPHACMVGDKPVTHWVDRLAGKAEACIAAGTCAAHGGIPAMQGTVTGSHTLSGYLSRKGIDKPVVNLPNCPMKPEHFVYTVLHYAMTGKLPELDGAARPRKFFGRTLHERCVYYADFQEKRYARFIGDEGCLLKLGCQGPVTHSDCVEYGHNSNTNNCIRAGHPCVGCASEHFPRQIMLHTYRDKRPIRRRF
ncbi:MAG TPA: hydrogenase small subunit [Gammaproteobacteria bacterium]|nr:hydrogenase small subunit [Gammaproteobacteria bacterium]